MGNRLSRIVTRTGDDGTTGLGDGQRVAKSSARIEACGSVDELNCSLGLLLAEQELPTEVRAALTTCQHELFDLGGELCIPGSVVMGERHVERLELAIESLNEHLPPLKEFILPGGSRAAALCHLARATARRAERRCWTLAGIEAVGNDALRYLNRLSDLLFVCARLLARAAGSEVMWQRDR